MKSSMKCSNNIFFVFRSIAHMFELNSTLTHLMLKLVEKEILFLVPICLAGVANGDGQLLVALCTVDTDSTHHIGDALLSGGSPG